MEHAHVHHTEQTDRSQGPLTLEGHSLTAAKSPLAYFPLAFSHSPLLGEVPLATSCPPLGALSLPERLGMQAGVCHKCREGRQEGNAASCAYGKPEQ